VDEVMIRTKAIKVSKAWKEEHFLKAFNGTCALRVLSRGKDNV